MATFSAGSIEASLTIDRTPFTTGLDEARAQADEFERNKIEGKLGLDTAAAVAELDKLKAELASWGTGKTSRGVGLDADVSRAMARITELEAQLAKLEHTTTTHKVKVDVNEAEKDVNALMAAGLALAPALSPILASLAGGAAAVGGGFLAAGGATGVFAGAAILNIKRVMAAEKALSQGKALTAAQQQLLSSAPVQAFLANLDRAKAGLNAFLRETAPTVFTGAGAALGLFNHALAETPPVANSAGRSITGLVRQADRWGTSGGFAAMRNFFVHEGPIAIDRTGHALGNFGLGAGRMFGGLTPLANQFLAGWDRMMGRFAAWSADPSHYAGFMTYVAQEGPIVLSTLGHLASALVRVGQDIAPVGHIVLTVLDDVAKLTDAVAGSTAGRGLLLVGAAVLSISRAMSLGERVMGSSFGGFISGGASSARSRLAATSLGTAWRGATNDLRAYLNFGAMTRSELEAQQAAGSRLGAKLRTFGKAGLAVAAVGVAASGVTTKLGLTNTATLALAGSFAGPWGIAAGGAIGLMIDLSKHSNGLTAAMHTLDAAMSTGSLQAQAASLQAARARLQQQQATSTVSFQGGNSYAVNFHPDDAESQQLAQQAEQLQRNIELRKQLATAYGIPLPANASLKQLDQVAAQIGPRLAALGVQIDGLGAHNGPTVTIMRLRQMVAAEDSNRAHLGLFASSLRGVDSSLVSTAQSASAFSTALANIVNPLLSANQAQDAFRTNLTSLHKTLGQNQGGFTGFSRAALSNRDAVRQAASALTDLLGKMAARGDSSARLANTLEVGRAAIIRQGLAAGKSRGEMRQYLDTLGLTPKLVQTAIRVSGADKAKSSADGVNTSLNRVGSNNPQPRVSLLDRASGPLATLSDRLQALRNQPPIVVTISDRTIHQGINMAANQLLGATKPHAGGGLIVGRGGPTDDANLTPTSNREYVTRASVVDRLGTAFFDAVNAGVDPVRAAMRVKSAYRGTAAPPMVAAHSAPNRGSHANCRGCGTTNVFNLPPNSQASDVVSLLRAEARRNARGGAYVG